METELKLLLEPRHVARLRRHPLFRRAPSTAPRKLHSVYYDTPGLKLWRERVTLRVRREGSRWIQTVKGGGSVVTGLHRRNEVEAELAAPFPDCGAIADADLASHFAASRVRAQLEPVMVTEFTRASRMIAPADGVAIEASIDRGTLRSGDATEPVCELEIEVKSGPAWRAYQIALELLHAAPLVIENRSKAERGFALHLNVPHAPVKAGPSPLTAAMSGNDAFKSLAQSCLDHLIANQRGMLDRAGPEYLHQMRVALRRLRSVLSTFAPLFPKHALAEPVAETRWLAAALGTARDWDVFASETLLPVTARYAGHSGVQALARAAVHLQRSANRAARRAVASARGQGLLLALGGWLNAETWLTVMNAAQRRALSRPVSGFAFAVLDDLHQRVMRRGRHFARLAPPELHRLRVAAKKLRYAADFFSPLFDERRARGYRAALARLQDGLGAYNDAVTVTRLVALARRGLREVPKVSEARGIILGWSSGTRDAGTRHLRRIWKEFRAAKRFWR